MNKWILCVLLSSGIGSLMYGIWWLLSICLTRKSNQNEWTDLIYHSLRVTVIGFAVIVFNGLGFSLYLELNPGNTYWGVETPVLRDSLNIVTLVWAMGAAYQLLHYLIENISMYKRVKEFFPGTNVDLCMVETVKKRILCDGDVSVYRGVDIVVPELVGIRNAKIILPDEEYTQEQMIMILTHELIHHKYKDRFIREIAVLIHCIHWWNPLILHMHHSLERWDELHCDACVCDCDYIRKKDYAQVLYHISEQVVTHRQILHTALTEEGGNMVERMRQIQAHKKGQTRKKGLTVMVTLLLVLCTSSVSLAAGTGTLHLYDMAVDMTTEGEQEQLQPMEEWVEYRVYVGEDFLQTLETGDVQIQAQPSGTISTTLQNSRWSSGGFQATEGQVITVMVSPDPSTVQLKVGIFEPDGYLRYVLGTGNIMHDFVLDQTGQYFVIIQNDTGTKVKVGGYYQTRDVQ